MLFVVGSLFVLLLMALLFACLTVVDSGLLAFLIVLLLALFVCRWFVVVCCY